MKNELNIFSFEILKEIEKVIIDYDDSSLKIFEKYLLTKERIFLAGVGRTGLVIKSFAMRLMHLGLKVYVVGDINTPSINKNDLLIVGSGSGETETLVTITDKAKSLGVTIVLFTSNRSSKIAKQSRIVLAINSPSPKLKNNHGNKSIQPMGSLFEQSLMIILDSCILYLTKIMDMESTKMFVKHANLE